MAQGPTMADDAAALEALLERVGHAMAGDRPGLRRDGKRLRERARKGLPIDRGVSRLTERLEASIARRSARQQAVPVPSYPAELPVVQAKADLFAAIRDHQVVIVCGETGSGKSTQLPKLCLELGRGVDGMIGHTQPRRIAARSLASRIADELAQPMGDTVGYQVRFEDRVSDRTLVKLMTDGILLAETRRDRRLAKYDTLILDEAHERSLNIDFLLGYLKGLLPQRPDLKLIITSATIDPERFAEHFPRHAAGGDAPAPIVTVGGRGFPVETRYRPLSHSLTRTIDEAGREAAEDAAAAWLEDVTESIDLPEGVRRAVDEAMADGPGDVLVFLPTERDILEHARSLRGALSERGEPVEILPLYARLSPREQAKVFQPHKRRRVVLSTNVAETSLTVPGIRYVVDSGLARIGRYAATSGVFRLPIEPVSRASADQRRGRCGREGPGVCFRLFSEDDYLGREEHTPPEIRRSNLAQVILRMASLGLGDVGGFPFLDPPRHAAVRDGYDTLFELGALTRDKQLTAIGERLAEMPIDPRLGRMLIAGHEGRCLAAVLPIVSALAVGEVRLRPPEDPEGADRAHAMFVDERSDFLTLLNVWGFVHRQRLKLSRRGFQHACRDRMLSHTRCREWLELHRQLREQGGELGLRITGDETQSDHELDADAFHLALMTGLVTHVAMRTDAVTYTGVSGRKLRLWPGSVLFKPRPKWIVAAELVETTQLYGRLVAPIRPKWLENVAPHMLSRKYGQAGFDPKTGRTVIAERATLRGLVVVPRRDVPYGKVDPVKARRLFIREALVYARHGDPPAFLRHNLELIAEAAKLEAKTRTKGLVASDDQIEAFYDRHLPEGIDSAGKLEGLLKREGQHRPDLLKMTWDDVLARPLDEQDTGLPDVLELEGLRAPLRYVYDPNAPDDGVTVQVPVAVLGRLNHQRLAWLVPGLLRDKVTELLRTLPKPERRRFVPLPETAAAITPVLRHRFGDGPLPRAVAAALQQVFDKAVNADDFDLDALPANLKMNVEVVDTAAAEADSGAPVVASGRDLRRLWDKLGERAAQALSEIEPHRFHLDGIRTWDFGTLPETVAVRRAGARFEVYPALIDRGDTASLRLFDRKDRATQAHRRGVQRLLAIGLASPIKPHLQRWEGRREVERHAAPWPHAASLMGQLRDAVVARACEAQQPQAVRDGLAFSRVMESAWDRLATSAKAVTATTEAIFEAYHRVGLRLDAVRQRGGPATAEILEDVSLQLSMTLPPRFLADTPAAWLDQLPRHLQAIAVRLEKLAAGRADREAGARHALRPYATRLATAWPPPHDLAWLHSRPSLANYRWMLAEYRVSLFAQELGTALPVSAKRLDEQWRRAREAGEA